jgi:AGZA family xanthine/uracil permease-like MFS transporter
MEAHELKSIGMRALISRGDVGAFFGLMLDNVSNLVILAGSLVGIFGMPTEVVYYKMLPGSAIGVLIGDIAYTYMAFALSKKTGRNNITAMPLGLDTPSTLGLTFGVMGPLYLKTKDPIFTWQVGMAVIVCMGIFKILTAFFGDIIRRLVPRASLLGSIAGIAILMIAFLPLTKVFHEPMSGFLSMIIILFSLVAKRRMPLNIPGAFAAIFLGSVVFYLMQYSGLIQRSATEALPFLYFSAPTPTLEFLGGLREAINYLPLAIPFALATVIGGIDVTESAAVAGDEYKTRDILLVEGIATLFAGLCGGVIQSTPYIGHPAYKKMGGKSGYTLGTALFIGLGGVFGYLSYVVRLIPEGVIAPILLFIGLEITSQAFIASPRKHYEAIAIAFIPPLANLVIIELGIFLGAVGVNLEALQGEMALSYKILKILGNGFILTSLLWSGFLVFMIESEDFKAFLFLILCCAFTLFGFIHSPLEGGRLFLPWRINDSVVYFLSLSYLISAFLILVLRRYSRTNRKS